MNGRKRHIAVDTCGLLLAELVTGAGAGVQDLDGARPLPWALHACFPGIRLIWADSGYAGQLVGWATDQLKLTVQIEAKLAATANGLDTAMNRICRLAYAIVDGTLIPTDRGADQKPYYSGKHRRHGMNVQVISDPAGRLVWASPALPGQRTT